MTLDRSKPLPQRPETGPITSGSTSGRPPSGSGSPAARSLPASGSKAPLSDYERAQAFLYDRIDYERLAGSNVRYTFRLKRMRELLRRLELGEYLHEPGRTPVQATDPQRKPPVPLVHLAGTKGKGSTAAMVAAMLTANGYRTGLYTSPHLHRLEERFQIDGRCCSEDELVALVQRIRDATSQQSDAFLGDASFFELTTALALLHFHQRQCDAIVLEVGLGGRLDSTNVCLPTVTAITTIGLDHQHVLGDTLDKIAVEKAGIIKPNIPVVSGVRPLDQSASAVELREDPGHLIEAIARERSAPISLIGRDFDFDSHPHEIWGSELTYRSSRRMAYPGTARRSAESDLESECLRLGVEGEHQAHNAAVALAIVDRLRDQKVMLAAETCHEALAAIQCPARVERFQLPRGVTGILDASHNEDSVAALCRTLDQRFAHRDIRIVFGTSRDKPAAKMLKQLVTHANRLFLTRFHGNPRYVAPEKLLSLVVDRCRDRCRLSEDPVSACEMAFRDLAAGGALVVCGSFFTAAEARGWMQRLQESMDDVHPSPQIESQQPQQENGR